jgi:hypothetical protein
MLDARLTAQAKAIYAYFASFAGAGTAAFPRRSTIMRDLNLSPTAYYPHFNLLIEHGYLSVENRKSNGRFDVSLYRLSESVESPHAPHRGKQKALSEKQAHGKNGDTISYFPDKGENSAPMSEKPVHGKMLKTPAPLSEKPMSEKPLSEKTVHGNFGQANINNNSTSNNFFENEQVENHQGCAPDDKIPVPLFFLEQAKALMRYEDLRCEALAWGELKEMLGHFAAPRDKARYMRKAIELLDEVASQIRDELNRNRNPQHIADILEGDAFAVFFSELLDRWDQIRSVRGYVGASMKNVLSPRCLDEIYHRI